MPRDIDTDALMQRIERPDLIVQAGDLPATMRALRDMIADTPGALFDRGRPVRIVTPPGQPVRLVPVTPHSFVELAHDVVRPVTTDNEGKPKPVTLPERVAKMWLDCGDQRLPPLDGVATGPLLAHDGTIRTASGYDAASRLWCAEMPTVHVSPQPTKREAEHALRHLRETFASFPFADAERVTVDGFDLVDADKPPGSAESSFLAGLLTAICRPSLWLAPGLLVTAPDISGAGSGKGLLVQAICEIAFGSPPVAFTAGNDKGELDKRIASELLQTGAALFLDNVNATALKSDTLASVLTERPARVRLFGQTSMAELNSTAWVAVTGNGLTVSEDLARRFLACELDPKCDDPEGRQFAEGRDEFLVKVRQNRSSLLAAALTIWRWGRQKPDQMQHGKPLGSFETWASWVRDPLLTLGCTDPVEAIAKAKAHDPRRLRVAELFNAWWDVHDNLPVRANSLADAVRDIIDPQGRGRQYVVTALNGYVGTRAGGFVLTRQDAPGKWGTSTYSLQRAP